MGYGPERVAHGVDFLLTLQPIGGDGYALPLSSGLLPVLPPLVLPLRLLTGWLLGLALLAQHRHEEPLATRLAWQEPVAAMAAQELLGDVPFRQGGHRHTLRAQRAANPVDIFLILMGVERAGGVDEQSASPQTGPHVLHDAALQLPAFLHMLFAPLGYRPGILAEHALAGAWHVGEDDMFSARMLARSFTGSLVKSRLPAGRAARAVVLLPPGAAQRSSIVTGSWTSWRSTWSMNIDEASCT